MTDRELLEYAAKAAGYNIRSDAWARKLGDEGETLYIGNHGPAWNPLTDDGDALRLAVKCKIDVLHGDNAVVAELTYGDGVGVFQDYGNDPYAATRRAIVKAAAAIGERM